MNRQCQRHLGPEQGGHQLGRLGYLVDPKGGNEGKGRGKKKINLPKNWVFSDNEIISNIKNEGNFINSNNLNNIEIKNLTNLITNFKKTFNKVS